jgi:hypothetical protein
MSLNQMIFLGGACAMFVTFIVVVGSTAISLVLADRREQARLTPKARVHG